MWYNKPKWLGRPNIPKDHKIHPNYQMDKNYKNFSSPRPSKISELGWIFSMKIGIPPVNSGTTLIAYSHT
jgi:hypothetical protein